jgi:hypothetical protein
VNGHACAEGAASGWRRQGGTHLWSGRVLSRLCELTAFGRGGEERDRSRGLGQVGPQLQGIQCRVPPNVMMGDQVRVARPIADALRDRHAGRQLFARVATVIARGGVPREPRGGIAALPPQAPGRAGDRLGLVNITETDPECPPALVRLGPIPGPMAHVNDQRTRTKSHGEVPRVRPALGGVVEALGTA